MYVIGALMWGRFFVPVLALFYVASQVPLEQFAIIMGVFSLSILVFEIPTGALADLLGKKKTLLLSRFMYILEIFLIAFFNGFWIFLIAKIISGIGVSLTSGTGSAMLFDTLKKQKREGQYKKISGNLGVIVNISMATVFIIGAYLFSISPKLPAFVSLPFIILGFILTFFLEEPYKSKKNLTFKHHFIHMKKAISFFKKSDVVKYIAFLTFFTSAAVSISLSMSSAYFEQILIPISLIGLLAFISSMITAFTSKKADKWESLLKEKKSIWIIQIVIILGLFLISLTIPYYGYLFYLLIPFISGFEGVILGNYAHNHIPTSHRATILSVMNMFGNIGIFLLFPLSGYVMKNYGIGTAFIILGLITLFGFIALYFYSKDKDIKFTKNPT
jgi:MFS family permease